MEASDQIGYTILHLAARDAFPELISLLVQARVNLDATLETGATALHLAARYGAVDCVEVLLAAGATPNLLEKPGRTPFGVAVLWGHRRIWPLLLRAGAEIPTAYVDPYIVRVRNAGGWKKYEQAHLARIASILETPLLPPELVRKVLEFHLHAGFY